MSLAEYDALPPPVRRVLRNALVCLGTRRAAMNLIAGKTVAEVCAIERAVAQAAARRDMSNAYGATHPFMSKPRPG